MELGAVMFFLFTFSYVEATLLLFSSNSLSE
jgi:hypothetical protein